MVPDLSGLARPRAIADVEAANLQADVATSFSLSAPRGAVTSQDPAAGAVVREGDTVTVVVSRGVRRVEMPDAVGQPLTDVVPPLDEVGVEYRVDRVPSETVPEGIVIEQTPDAGRRVTAADSVSFVVSSGPEPRAVLDVRGLSTEGAAYALGRAGFVIEKLEERPDDEIDKGVVLGTEPATGTVLPRDTPITVLVSSGLTPVSVPDLIGATQEAAVAALEDRGLVANLVGGGPTGGTIAVQDPEAGSTLTPGGIVSVEVRGG